MAHVSEAGVTVKMKEEEEEGRRKERGERAHSSSSLSLSLSLSFLHSLSLSLTNTVLGRIWAAAKGQRSALGFIQSRLPRLCAHQSLKGRGARLLRARGGTCATRIEQMYI
jgi:hypothetical protein